LLSGIQPVFFLNKLDLTRNVLMMTGLHQAILHNSTLCTAFDLAFLVCPIALAWSVIAEKKIQPGLAIFTSLFSLVYFMLLSQVSYLCIEGFIGGILVPLIFCARSVKVFYYYLHCIRIIFMLIFFSAGLWKIRTGAVFNTEQMSGILLLQHPAYLVSDSHDWFSRFIYYLVSNAAVSYALYLSATAIELLFAVGLFTRRYDKWLIGLFCLFVIFDYFLMRINYFNWMVFTGCLYFSRYGQAGDRDKISQTNERN
jgi:hypothetical protein